MTILNKIWLIANTETIKKRITFTYNYVNVIVNLGYINYKLSTRLNYRKYCGWGGEGGGETTSNTFTPARPDTPMTRKAFWDNHNVQ